VCVCVCGFLFAIETEARAMIRARVSHVSYPQLLPIAMNALQFYLLVHVGLESLERAQSPRLSEFLFMVAEFCTSFVMLKSI
jgi:hypothetical protein